MTTPPTQPPGGYGAPQPPHQPPQPPNQPPPPAGYPGATPNPYAQPDGQNPYAQPAAAPYAQPGQAPYGRPGPYGPPQGAPGFPQAPGFPPPPAPPAGPRKKRTVILAAALAGILVISAGAYFAFGRDGDKKDAELPVAQASGDAKPSASPTVDEGNGDGDGSKAGEDLNADRKPGEDKVLWLKMNDQDVPGGGADAPVMWVVGDTVVKVVYRTVTGYAVKDGKPRWTVPFTGDICGTPRQTTADGKVVLAFKNGTSKNAKCNQLRQLDLKTGTAGWSHDIPEEGMFDIMTTPGMAITGDTVTVSRMGPSSAFRVSDGKKLFVKATGNCLPDAYAGGTRLVAVANCTVKVGDVRKEQIQGLDPVTGKVNWTYKAPDGWRANKVYSVDPVVVDLNNDDKKKRAIIVLGTDGKIRAQIKSKSQFATDCGWSLVTRDLQSCYGPVVDGNTFYFPTADDSDNAVVAFDLTTGKEKWRSTAGAGRTLQPMTAQGGTVYAYRKAVEGKGGEVVSLTGGGKPKAVLRNPSSAASVDVEKSFYEPQIAYADGRLFLSVTHLTGKDDVQEKLMMVFGK
ncbi:PQQ-binding-like beta-propeller repeat protein [Streptomyces sp. NPDC089919]|uniref:outer membrane protein assembly factor BamB family protein n=1 Tax=Streptomyces sp. NPDC089919 TaxID=3155188 RepID=UPI00343262D0